MPASQALSGDNVGLARQTVGARKGGEMLTEFNRIRFQIFGIIVAFFAGCLLYLFLGDILVK